MPPPDCANARVAVALGLLLLPALCSGQTLEAQHPIYYTGHLAKDEPRSVAIGGIYFTFGVGLIHLLARLAVRRRVLHLPAGFACVDPNVMRDEPWALAPWKTDDAVSLVYIGDAHHTTLTISGLPNGAVCLQLIGFSAAEETYLAIATCADHGGLISPRARLCRQPDNRIRLTIADARPHIDLVFQREQQLKQQSKSHQRPHHRRKV
jgi:hypothetical protein